MARIHLGVLTILAMGLLISSASARDRKGRVLSETNTTVAIDENGRPVVAGKCELEIKSTSKGFLLAIRIPRQDGRPSKVRYLAYPTEKDAAAEVRTVTEPGPGCYWTKSGLIAGKLGNENLLEIDFFVTKEGPFKGFELRHDEKGRLILADKRTPNIGKRYIGRRIEYDNLDDGK